MSYYLMHGGGGMTFVLEDHDDGDEDRRPVANPLLSQFACDLAALGDDTESERIEAFVMKLLEADGG